MAPVGLHLYIGCLQPEVFPHPYVVRLVVRGVPRKGQWCHAVEKGFALRVHVGGNVAVGIFGKQGVARVAVRTAIVGLSLHALGRCHCGGHLLGRPPAALPDVVLLVHIVGIGHQRITPQLGEAQQETTAQPALPGAACGLHIADVPHLVLLLQIDIHHIAFGAVRATQGLVHVRCLVIHLDVFHRVVGQVLQQHLPVSAHEGAGTQQQFVHLAPIDIDFAIVLHFHAGQLGNEGIEHGTVGQLEGRGVIDERVALPVHLDLCGHHVHLLQLNDPEHTDDGYVYLTILLLLRAHLLPDVTISGSLGMDEVLPVLRPEFCTVDLWLYHTLLVVECRHGDGILHHGAVGTAQRDLEAGHPLVEEPVLYPSRNLQSRGRHNAQEILVLLADDAYGPAIHHCMDGLLERQVVKTQGYAKILQVIIDEVDVYALALAFQLQQCVWKGCLRE